MTYDEKAVLDTIEKVSKSVVNISTVKLVHDIFYQAVPVGGMGSGTIIDSEDYLNQQSRGGWSRKSTPLFGTPMLGHPCWLMRYPRHRGRESQIKRASAGSGG
jgi:hypothetical protein